MRHQAKTPLFKGGIKRRLAFESSMGEKANALRCGSPVLPALESGSRRLRARRTSTTQHMGWRWLFYINLPVGIFSLLLGAATMRESKRQNLSTDWLGLLLMAIGVGSLQIVLSRGNEDYWFDSKFIVTLTILAFFGILIFLLRGWMIADNIINLHLFRDRSFAAATLITGVFGLGLFGTTAMQPLMLEGLLNYMPETTGWVMFPRGVASAVAMMIVGRLINRYQPRLFIIAGVLLTGISTWIMTSYSLYISPAWIIYQCAIKLKPPFSRGG